MDLEKLKAKWRQKSSEILVPPCERTLQTNRPPPPKPEPPPLEGSYCQRCGDLTPEIRCVYMDYWICPRCASFHIGLIGYASRVYQFRMINFCLMSKSDSNSDSDSIPY